MDIREFCKKMKRAIEIHDPLAKDVLYGSDIADYKMMGYGRNRISFSKAPYRFIVKIPKNQSGVQNNLFEYWKFLEQFADYGESRIVARCRLVYISGLQCLFMESLDIVQAESLYPPPAWSWLIDSDQIGVNRKGNVVAYDFA